MKETAVRLGNVSPKLIYKLYHRGELFGAKIAGTVRIRAASVAAYLEAHSNQKNARATSGVECVSTTDGKEGRAATSIVPDVHPHTLAVLNSSSWRRRFP